MTKKLHLIFTFFLIVFTSSSMFGQFTVNYTKKDINCSSPTGSITVSGIQYGFGPYTYIWSNGATTSSLSNLSAGNYTVTVKDWSGLTATATVTINTYKAIAVQTNASCGGTPTGSATVAVKGGSGNYSYSWNTPTIQTTQSATGLSAGTYTVTVTDNQTHCVTTANVDIDLNPTTPVGDPTVYGNNVWNVYVWNKGVVSNNAWQSDYSGYFTANTLSFNSEDYYEDYNVPSSVSGYQGCKVNGDDHSWSAKRQGFPCGYYKIDIPIHDDWVRLFIDDIQVFGDNNCCESHTAVWQGFLDNNSKVEFKIAEERGQSRGNIKFNLIAPTAAITNVTCNGGQNGAIALTPATNDSYTYNWGNGITTKDRAALAAGDYTVAITSPAGCTETKTYTVSQPDAFVITPSQTNVTCHGGATGSARVSVTGGTGTYSYSWAPSGGSSATASGLGAGTYTVTVTDANSCTATQSFIITEPDELVVSQGSQTNISCHGANNGSATVRVAGGTGSYSYSWSPSGGTAATASGLGAGTYTVTVTDANSCTATQSFIITEPDELVASQGSQTNISCHGANNGSATVRVAGGTGSYSYSWSPSGGTAATASGLGAGTYTVTVTDANSCTATQSFIITEPDVLTATAVSQTNIACHGAATGAATVSVAGGTGAHSYSWSPSGGTSATASGLSAGTYTVTVTDSNACTATQSFTITEPDELVASQGSQTNIACHGAATGAATVSASGGTGTYSYSWAPSGGTSATASGLGAGTYIVTVTDANVCTATQSFTITEPDVLTATAVSQTNIACHGANTGSASVSVSGGKPGYSYSWAPFGGNSATATGLSAGTYTVTVTDANSCTATESFTITEPNVLTATAVSQTNIACHGANTGSASVSVNGGKAGYSYSWAPSGGNLATATGLSAGTYIVTVTDANSCTATQSFTITEPNVLTATAVSQTNIACHGANTGSATVGVSGGKSGYNYSWAPSGGNSETATGLSAGTYTVTVTDANSCTTTQSFTITEPTLLESITSKTDVSCYSGNDGAASVNVSGGKGAYTYLWSPKGGNEATASGLTAGTYSITITDANSCSISKTLVIEEPTAFTVNTLTATGTTVSSAIVSGIISSENSDGKCLTETGFVYSLKSNPLITDNKIIAGSSLGSITSTLTNLKGNTSYYVKAYAINSNGFVAYGNEISFSTNKYTLTITASAGHQKVFGTTDPVFNYTISGLVNGDTNTIVAGVLSRETGENVGKYKINAGTIDAGKNYKIVFESAVFEITKADQVITWNQDLEFGCETENSINLNAVSNSGLPITYSVVNSNIAEVSVNNLAIKSSGSTSITATQNGDQNHNPAVAVIKPIEVTQGGLITQHWSDVLFFDNKNKDFVSWQWYKNGTAISGATRQYFNENQALNGTYYVIAIGRDGNKIKSCLFEITGKVFSNNMKIYPNPVKASSEFTLECNFSEAQLKGAVIDIFDINGKLIQTVSNVKTQNQIIAPSQTAIYVVLLALSNGEKKTINVLVK